MWIGEVPSPQGERARVRGDFTYEGGCLKRPNIDKSRELRRNLTDPERKLWKILRNRQLEGIKFRRQFPIGAYILDFYAPEYRIAIEADGGQHYQDKDIGEDSKRTASLSAQGIQILRFSNRDIMQNIEGVCEVILRAVREKSPSP
jgi:very-short-patch-repair endonuclease